MSYLDGVAVMVGLGDGDEGVVVWPESSGPGVYVCSV